MSQNNTSKDTSIRSVASVFKKIGFVRGTTNLDIGGGKYENATHYCHDVLGVKNFVYDPYNRTYHHNLEVMRETNGKCDTITVANVLNVIDDDVAMHEVIAKAARCIKKGGTVYFQIYEGDRSGNGKETTKGFQRNQKTSWYQEHILRYFHFVTRKGNILIANTSQDWVGCFGNNPQRGA